MRLLLILLVFLFSLSGCAGTQRQPPAMLSLESSKALRFSDIPYPIGFKVLKDKSFILETDEVRAGRLFYRGKADVESVVLFYKSQMPIYNWALLNILEYGEHMLNFERENESCIVAITSRGAMVDISISLAPKSRTYPEARKAGILGKPDTQVLNK